ncbi:MAG: hypothetical protein J6Y93_03325 [Treponema sp.]|nr:hypothetical protein [Treponema sp.]
MNNSELIKEFVENRIIIAMEKLIDATSIEEIKKAAVIVASAFGSSSEFEPAVNTIEAGKRLTESFKKNLSLLIQKTWVEQDDVALKEQVLYKLDQFCEAVNSNKWAENFKLYLQILNDAIYLMFGTLSKTDEFDEYSLRIDPEFGVFWWFIENLPRENEWSEDKSKVVLLLGMFFLANY